MLDVDLQLRNIFLDYAESGRSTPDVYLGEFGSPGAIQKVE